MTDTQRIRRVAVIGAGLGGLAAALALRARGFEAVVYERTRELRHAGIGLTLHPNGLRALDALAPGLAREIIDQGACNRSVTFHDVEGNVLMRMPLDFEERYGYPQVLVRWHLVQASLARRLPPEALVLGSALTAFEQHAQGVVARFADGRSVEADLLVACDGVHSLVRKRMHGDDARFLGRVSHRGFVYGERDAKGKHERWPRESAHIFMSRAGETALLADVGSNVWFWNVTVVSDEETRDGSPELRARLLERVRDWQSPLYDAIAATPASELLVRPVYDRLPIASWHEGRVLLLADAAHAMSPSFGQGANAAFEDAVVLGRCLRERATLEDALTRLEALRVERTQTFQARNQEFGQGMHEAQSTQFLASVAETVRLDPIAFNDWMVRYDVTALEI